MEDKTVTLARHLALVVTASQEPGIRVAELARRFNRSEEDILADLEVLDRAGFGSQMPDEMFGFEWDRLRSRGEVKLWFDLNVTGVPPLSEQEAAGLITGLAALSPQLPPEVAEGIPTLLAKVLSLAPALADRSLGDLTQLLAVIDQEPASEVEDTVRAAIERREQMRLTYLSARSHRSERTVDPISLTQETDGWVLRAWCHLVEAERHFRLDRILAAELTGHPAENRLGGRASKGSKCTVVLQPEAKWLVGQLPLRDVRSEGELIVGTFRVFDDDWLIAQLISLAPYLVAVRPQHWADQARERAQRALAVWDRH